MQLLSCITRGFTSKASSGRMLGSVKWFESKKGFGFITPNPESGLKGDVFVHQSNIVSATGFRTLTDNLPVSFICKKDDSGRDQAYEVAMADGSPVKTGSNN